MSRLHWSTVNTPLPSAAPPAGTRRYTLVAIVLIDLVGMTMVIPLLPNYAKTMQASGLTLGLLLGVFGLMQLVFSPVWGRLSDRLGRRPILMLTMLGAAGSYVIIAMGDYYQALWLLFVGRIIGGITGANIAVAQTVMSDITGPEDRAAGMGLLGAAFGIGFVLGPALTAATGMHFTWLPALIAAGLSTLAAGAVYHFLPETLARRVPPPGEVPPSARNHPYRHFLPLQPQEWKDVMANRELVGLLALAGLNMLAFSMLHSTFIPLLRDRTFVSWPGGGTFHFTLTTSTLMLMYVGLWIVIVQGGLIGRLSRRFGEYGCATVGVGLLSAGFFLFPLCFSLPAMLGSVALYAIGNGLTNPSISSLISRTSPDELRGQVLGLAGGLASLATALGQIMGGWLYDLTLWPNRIGGTEYSALSFWVSSAIYLGCFVMLKWSRRGAGAKT